MMAGCHSSLYRLPSGFRHIRKLSVTWLISTTISSNIMKIVRPFNRSMTGLNNRHSFRCFFALIILDKVYTILTSLTASSAKSCWTRTAAILGCSSIVAISVASLDLSTGSTARCTTTGRASGDTPGPRPRAMTTTVVVASSPARPTTPDTANCTTAPPPTPPPPTLRPRTEHHDT